MLAFGLGIYPRPGAWRRTLVWTWLVAACAGTADTMIPGADSVFPAATPTDGSLLSVLGSWPSYLASVAAVAVAMVLALQAIAVAVDRRDPRAQSRPSARGYVRA